MKIPFDKKIDGKVNKVIVKTKLITYELNGDDASIWIDSIVSGTDDAHNVQWDSYISTKQWIREKFRKIKLFNLSGGYDAII